MIPPSLDYLRAESVDQAVEALRQHGDEAKLLAGGQSLLPLLRLRLAYPSVLVDVSRIGELRGVREEGDAIVIGSMTTHTEVITNPLIQQYAGLLAAATKTVADPAVRHRGTIGGALAHADPAGDLPAVALTLGAEMVAAGVGGRRTIAASDFFADYLQTALQPDELLTAIRIPKRSGWGFHYEKFHRVAQAWAIVGVAAAVHRDNGSISEALVGLTNMGPTPLRAQGVESALAGAHVDADTIRHAADAAADGTSPPSDLNGAADYREHLARVLTRRAVARAAGVTH
jgi:carbon-monoxide dehydrogenase medium subunit